MRIVIINDMLWGGGRERRIVQLISGLNDAGYNDVHLILLDDRIDYEEVYNLNVTITKIIRSSNKDFSVFRKLYKILKTLNPDVVNTWSFMSTFYAAPISKLLRIKCIGSYIVDCNNPKFLSLNFFAKHIGFFLCEKIVSNSYAGHVSYKTPISKRVVIYNGFDNKRHNNLKPEIEILNELKLSSTTKIVAMAARFDKQKDFDTFIKACQLLRQKRNDFVAICMGQGELLEETQLRVTQKSDPYILFTGFRNDIESLIRVCDIGVLCTNPNFHKEGVSNSILEFMAFSKPVVATSGGGTNEIIIDNQNGFLIEPFDSINLANRINVLFDDNQLYDRLSISALETVVTKFALNKMTSDFIELYKNDKQWK
jgi:glycosyltransferase involved in cell wall biosynthesis